MHMYTQVILVFILYNTYYIILFTILILYYNHYNIIYIIRDNGEINSLFCVHCVKCEEYNNELCDRINSKKNTYVFCAE